VGAQDEVTKRMSRNNPLAIRFWTEFDDVFHYKKPPEILNAYRILFHDRFAGSIDFDLIYNSWSDSRSKGDYPEGFKKAFGPLKEHVLYLADKQIEIMRNSFQEDTLLLQTAFEDFGQGILYDPNPNRPGDSIHKMDDFSGAPVGYHRWHAFIRAAVLLGADRNSWLHIDRCVGLAWAIQSEAQIIQNSPNNPGLENASLEQLRSSWLQLSFEDLDTAFDSYPFPK
jgi:hypothetical protein